MGIEPGGRQPWETGARRPAAGQPIAAFDFDGTLTVRDSFNAFLTWRAPPVRLVSGLLRLTPAALRYGLDRDRERMKSAAVAEFLKGQSREALEAEAEAFAEAHWPVLMRPDALATWERWKAAGAWRVIVTASPTITVAPFAKRLGADDLIGTLLSFDPEDRVAGAFEGSNCRAAEKVVRLRRAYGEDVRLAAAYGDSSGDYEMLELAEERGLKVFKGRP
jgi:phosphatidylglycerophosphatase C